MAAQLRQWGHRVERAAGFDAAAERLRRLPAPEVVLVALDALDEGAGDPAELIPSLRGDLGWPEAHLVLLIQASDEPRVLPRLLDWACDDFLLRPLRAQAFDARLRIWQRTRALHEGLDATQRVLRVRATRDALTAVWNRAAVIGHLYREVSRAIRDGSPLAAALCDVDGFKAVNDRFGHVQGDEVLRQVAARIEAVVRPQDVVGRQGGDEFVVLLPGCEGTGAIEIAERVRRAVSDAPLATRRGPVVATLSVGVCWLGERGPSVGAGPEALLEAADRAMYEAKRAGRNRVATWCPAADLSAS